MVEKNPPLKELQDREKKLKTLLSTSFPEWRTALILDLENIYYLTGSRQNGFIQIQRDADLTYYVKKSYKRAKYESKIMNIKKINKYSDILLTNNLTAENLFMDLDSISYITYLKLQNCFNFLNAGNISNHLKKIRAVKSEFEISIMQECGEIHSDILMNEVPKIVENGISEVELISKLYPIMISKGHEGRSILSMSGTDMVIGQISFSENSIYPTSFNGPAGSMGLSAASPVLGSRSRLLRNGDLVFLDICCNIGGYHTDKTMLYFFGRDISKKELSILNKCKEIEDFICLSLKPGVVVSSIYKEILSNYSKDFLANFMGYKEDAVKFIGHGVGLNVDEFPVICKRDDTVLKKGMVLAVEPKAVVEDSHLVGVENCYIVDEDGGKLITGYDDGYLLLN